MPITNRLRAVLQAYVTERGVTSTDALFIGVGDTPLTVRTIQHLLKEYGKKTKVGKEVSVSPHAIRRTFCRFMRLRTFVKGSRKSRMHQILTTQTQPSRTKRLIS
ncbi:tyrosine-type recombinase/integrase [Rossellomorea marisflavi]|uniref:tyrosine-type recombinase/integrase n=1 Tax=Rossellomorea marisflavi TaxID=189381 RepID=UPI003459D031